MLDPRRLLPAVLALLAVAPGSLAQAQLATDTTSRISVSVSRSARIAPDRVAVFATIEGSAETAPDAARRAEQKLQSVVAAVRALGARVETAGVPYGVVLAQNPGGYPQAAATLPHVARYAVKVYPRSLSQLQEVAAAAIAAGATGTGIPQFELASADSVRRALTAQAVRQAEAEADAVAAALGGRRGSLVDVSVGGSGGPAFSGFNTGTINFSSRVDYGGQAPAPEVQLQTSVTVRYRLVR